MQAVTLTQADVPILDTEIDRAEFAPPMLYDIALDFYPWVHDGGDVTELVENIMQQLEWHISEG